MCLCGCLCVHGHAHKRIDKDQLSSIHKFLKIVLIMNSPKHVPEGCKLYNKPHLQ